MRVVADDLGVPEEVRDRAASMAELEHTEDDAVEALDGLYEWASPFGLDDEYESADDLARVVNSGTFLRRLCRPEVYRTFLGSEELYREALRDEPDRATDDLVRDPEAVIFEGPYSWMVPMRSLRFEDEPDVTGALRSLQLSDPPFMILSFPAGHLASAGVRVRPPCALDAIPKRNWQWRRNDVPAEVIDRDIPKKACAGIEVRNG